AVRARTSWPEIVTACVQEGCVGETLAAAQLERAARTASPEVAEAVGQIGADEARHAELAWGFVAWSWRKGGPEVRRAITAAFRDVLAAPIAPDPREALLEGISDTERARAGRLPRGESVRVARRTLRDVVAPCARALLGSPFDPTPAVC